MEHCPAMLLSLRKFGTVARLVADAVGYKPRVPEQHTSVARSPGVDPGKPSRPLSMVWLHHSTGDRLLRGGLLEALRADGVDFHDINYEEATSDGDGYVIGDHTDIPDWPRTFNTPASFDVVRSWELAGGRQHDVVMFKSCYPNSRIASDARLEELKGHFDALLPTFAAHPDILFIPMSTPPLVKASTPPDAARRARTLSRWLTGEYPRDLKNLKVFDLFDALAITSGEAGGDTLAPQFATGLGDSHPSPEGARAVTRLFIPWFNRVVREAGLSA